MREINHVKKCETWVDGPNISPSKSLANAHPQQSCTQTYGYMDSHKKIMIRQWVENQTNQVFHSDAADTNTTAQSKILPITLSKNISDDEEMCIETTLNEITESLCNSNRTVNKEPEISIKIISSTRSACELQHGENAEIASMRSAVSSHRQNDSQEDEDQDSGPSEIPPALPLIEPLSSREISHDSIHMMCSRHVSRENLGLNIQTIDCGLQVTEEEIAREMGRYVMINKIVFFTFYFISLFRIL